MSETVRDPHFVCENCGFANVRLIDGGALCTECGTRYLPRTEEESA